MSSPTEAAERRPVKRALVSVYDKTGLLELATGLHALGVEVVSTGSTAQVIADAGVPVTAVEALTGFPECLDGRVKTLHPRVHAGLLADTRRPEHLAQLAELGIAPFELLVSNLYPFTATVASGATPDECVEQIDVGGPAMVRASAKNHDSVAVVVDPSRYDWVLESVKEGGFTLADRRALAVGRVPAHRDLRRGRRLLPGQRGRARRQPVPRLGRRHLGPAAPPSATARTRTRPRRCTSPGRRASPCAEQLSGKEMSYNNYVDADAAWRAAHDHGDVPCVAVIKHANPCGIAIGADVAEAHRKAHATDPTSAFGGVIAVNGEVSVELAEQVAEIFTEVIVAPAYAEGASAVLAERRNLRVLRLPVAPPRGGAELRPVSGGLLLQQRDGLDAPGDDPPPGRSPPATPSDDDVLADLVFAWRACRSVKSNAILLATDGAAVGVGMGQVNRVDAARLAVARAGDRARGSVAASDAYFPFPDGLQVLLDAGVRAVVQPGRLGARPALGRGRRGGRRRRCTSRARATSPTDDEWDAGSAQCTSERGRPAPSRVELRT